MSSGEAQGQCPECGSSGDGEKQGKSGCPARGKHTCFQEMHKITPDWYRQVLNGGPSW